MKIAIITITFNPDIEELQFNIQSYIDQVSLVIIIDNSTSEAKKTEVLGLSEIFSKLKIIQLDENLGIAEAQNIGFTFALENGFDFIVEMDQDSKLQKLYIEKLLRTYQILSLQKLKIAAIGSVAVNEKNNDVYDGLVANVGYYKVEKTLSSGLLLSAEVVRKVGLKDSKMFIDLVDWEWCWRAKSLGYQTYIDSDVAIMHNLGDEHKKFLLFRIGIAAPFRHYYAFRNSLYLFSKSYVPLKWKVKTLILLFFKITIYPLFLNKGAERLRFMISGIRDYFKNKYGRYEGS